MVYTQRMRQDHPADGPRIRVARTYDAMSQEAADFICSALEQRPDLLLCASAGSTPTRAYELLAARYARDPGLFKQMRVLQIDEWWGLAPGSPATCHADLRRKILGPLHITSDRYKGFRTSAPKPDTECGRIARWLAGHGPIDICILGLGVNGHVAMNEPAAAMTPHAHVAKLARSSQQHVLLKTLVKKPRHGLTLGMGDILRSRRVLLLVNGKSKCSALSRLMKPGITARFPASFLWLHPDAFVLCDREAAADVLVRS
jgi:galactosamine-6-phosphate isomerase